MSRRRLGGGLGMLRGGRVSVGMQFCLRSRRQRRCCGALSESVARLSRGREDAAMDAEQMCRCGVLQRVLGPFLLERKFINAVG